MWQSELFCFTCCLSGGLCLCVDLSGGLERGARKRAREGSYKRNDTARSGNIHTAGRDNKYPSKN